MKIIIWIIFLLGISFGSCQVSSVIDLGNLQIEVDGGHTPDVAYNDTGKSVQKQCDDFVRSMNEDNRLVATQYVGSHAYGSSIYAIVHVFYQVKNDSCTECQFYQSTDSLFDSYKPHINQCYGLDPTMKVITGVQCFELGTQNPLKQRSDGVVNGKWVRLIYQYSDGSDSTITTVVSNGCSGVSIDGNSLKKQNAYDTSTNTDGVNFKFCIYNGMVLNGSCSENGIDTGCGGQTPFNYDSRNDSIINKCRIDTTRKLPLDSIKRNTDSLPSTATNPDGFNKLSDDIRSEHALDRQIMEDQLKENKKSNGLLQSLVDITRGISNKITSNFNKLFGLMDSNFVDNGSNSFENGGKIDTSDAIGGYDTGALMNKYRQQFADTIGDTILKPKEMDSIASVFDQFKFEIYTNDCDCNTEWFDYDINLGLYQSKFKIDICQYNIDTYTKPLFKIFAGILLAVLYRRYLFNLLQNMLK